MCDFFAKGPKALLQYDYKSNEERKSNNNKKKRTYNKKNEQIEKKQKFFMIFSQWKT